MNTDHTYIMTLMRLATWTTRGTRRKRSANWSWPNVRYEVLSNRSPELVERWLQRRLKRMPEANRNQLEAQLSGLTGEDRHEIALKLLSGRHGGR